MAKKRKEQALKEFQEQNEFLKNTEMLSAAAGAHPLPLFSSS
jgi:hypothetical protein